VNETPFAAPASASTACRSIVSPIHSSSAGSDQTNWSPPKENVIGTASSGRSSRSPPRFVWSVARSTPVKTSPTVGCPKEFARSSVIVVPSVAAPLDVNAGTPFVPGKPAP
jgi:hypothetical protein